MSKLTPFNRRGRNPITQGANDLFNMMDDFFPDSFQKIRETIWDTFKVDERETVNEYVVEAELPGVKKDEVDISLNEGRLTISVKREENVEEREDEYIHQERKVGSMQRSLFLENAKPETGSAKLTDGVLRITVPKDTQSDASSKIDIESVKNITTFMYTGRYIFSFNICSSFTSFLDAQINIPIPSINREIPAQESKFSVSSTMTTPNRAAVKGSASASVTAVDEDT